MNSHEERQTHFYHTCIFYKVSTSQMKPLGVTWPCRTASWAGTETAWRRLHPDPPAVGTGCRAGSRPRRRLRRREGEGPAGGGGGGRLVWWQQTTVHRLRVLMQASVGPPCSRCSIPDVDPKGSMWPLFNPVNRLRARSHVNEEPVEVKWSQWTWSYMCPRYRELSLA